MSEERSLALRFRWAALGMLAAFLAGGLFTRHPEDLGLGLAGAGVALAAASLLASVGPREGLGLALLAGAGVVLETGFQHGCLAWFGLCLLAFALPLTAGSRAALVFVAAGEAVMLGCLLTPPIDLGWTPWMAGVAVSAAGASLIARKQELIVELRAAQAGLAERSRAQERNRIARDLHDVIAHSLTVSLLHISGARLALADDPDDAARALAEAERLCRESLDEVRSIVSLMRDGRAGEPLSRAPLPGLEGLEGLVERFRGAGATVAYERSGDVEAVPATAGTTLYRIAQEAFTNAAKHAPGQPLSVRLARGRGRIELTVDSDGPPGTGRGLGLESMRERAEAVGGTCQAGPANGGWRVRASVPVKAAP